VSTHPAGEVRDVIAFRNFDRGVAVTAGDAVVDGGVAFDDGGANVAASAGVSLTDGFTFRRTGEDRGGSVVLSGGDATVVTGNVLVHGADGLFLEGRADLVVRDNRVVGDRSWASWASGGTVDWDANGYWGPGPTPFAVDGAPLAWSAWKATTGFDAGSGQSPALPTGTWLAARVNAYDGDRAHVIVHDWDGAGLALWDPSGWLAPGTPIRVRDAQDYYGEPVLETVFDGAPIALPTTLSTVAPLAGDVTHLQDLHTAPAFVVYVVERIEAPTTTPADSGGTGDTGDPLPPEELTPDPPARATGNRTRCGCDGAPAPAWLLVAGLIAQRRRKAVSRT
jgi:hypothetical protein